MLHAIGFPDDQMPQLLVHGWWNLGGAKMSKSVGNIVDPFVLADKYSADALRYYLMSDIATGQDADFSEERLVERYNTDLANSLGNLLNRTLTMVNSYRQGQAYLLQEMERLVPQIATEYFAKKRSKYCMSEFSVDARVLRKRSALQQSANQIHRSELLHGGWLSKMNRQALESSLYEFSTARESLRIIAILISPVLPKAAHGIFDQLNWKMELSGKEERFSLADAEWGRLPDGHVVGKPVPLFPRIER